MKSLVLSVALALLTQTDPAADQLLRRLIPVAFELSAEREAIDRLARKAELSPVEVKVVPGTERLPLVIHRLEISGRDSYDAVHFFVSMLRFRPGLAGVESARFDAGPGDTVRYVIRLAYPTAAEIPPEADIRNIVSMVEQLREDRLDALAVFTNAAAEHAIALTSVRIDDGITIEGLLRGAAARAALTASLEKAKLTVSRTEWSRKGACEAFSVTARPADPAVAEFTPASPLFDAGSAAFCAAASQPAPRHVVVPGGGPDFFLRLRDVELHDLFYVLNDLLPENFVVDENVKGRITLDVPESASVEELLRAIGSAELFIGPGPLRRVSTSKPPAPPTDRPGSGEPINVSLRHIHLSSVLCLLGEVSGREIRMPPQSQRRLSVFTTELPTGVLLDGLAPAAGTGAVNACEIPTASGSRLSNPLRFEQLGISDLTIAGIAHVGETWKAYVYPPGGPAMAIEAGQQLYDGQVKAIGAKGVTFVRDGKGEVEMSFEPLRQSPTF